jgi:serine/threonine-protein kinase RsbW
MSEAARAYRPVGVNLSRRLPKAAYAKRLPRRPESARPARALVTAALRQWGLTGIEDEAGVVVTELVSNAVKHACWDQVLVTVTRRGDALVRVAVVDSSAAMPVIRRPEPDAVNGRGLSIIAQMSDGRWGVDPLTWGARCGKRVWADLEASR